MSEKEKETGAAAEDQDVAAAAEEEDAAAVAGAPAELAGDDASPDEKEFEFVEEPSFDIEYKGNCAYEVKVSVPASNEKKQAEEVFEELQQDAQVPGFRRGKAPRRLLERKFGKSVRNDVADKLVGAAFRKLIKDQDLRPLSFPEVDGLDKVGERAAEAPIEFTLKFEVVPRVQLADYKGIEVERPVVKIDDSDIDEAVENMRQRFALYETVDEPAADGDQVILDFHGTIAGEDFQGNHADNYPYILGTQRFFPEFEAVLRGAKAGDEKQCEVAFPQDYHGKEVAGKTANFVIKVNEVKRRQAPEVTDEFAKQAGYESVADMREKIAEEMRTGTAATSDRMAERNALEKVIAASTYELPESLVTDSANSYFEQEVARLRQQRMPGAEIEEREEALRKEARENAEQEIKSFFTLREIGKAEGIEVTEEDFEAEAESIQARTGAERDMVTRFLQEDEHRDAYTDRIFRRKAMEALLAHVKIVEKELTRESDEENDTADA